MDKAGYSKRLITGVKIKHKRWRTSKKKRERDNLKRSEQTNEKEKKGAKRSRIGDKKEREYVRSGYKVFQIKRKRA